jgi:hypothetical protein
MLVLVGDDWAEDHHDVELMDADGRRLAKARLPEGVAGIARLHALIAEYTGDADPEDVEVRVGIETDRGPWVLALVAAGYSVFAINPMSVMRMCWLTWCVRRLTSCALSRVTVPRSRRSRCSRGRTRP